MTDAICLIGLIILAIIVLLIFGRILLTLIAFILGNIKNPLVAIILVIILLWLFFGVW